MIIALHVAVALLGVGSATYGYIRPTSSSIKVSGALAALTFLSGFFMVWAEPTQILRTCLSGIAYLSVVVGAIILTRRKVEMLDTEHGDAYS